MNKVKSLVGYINFRITVFLLLFGIFTFSCKKSNDPAPASTPQITNINPDSAEVGKVITVSITNFSSTENNTFTFTNISNSAITGTVITMIDHSPVTIVVPSTLTAGRYNLTLNNASQTSAAVVFKVISAAVIVNGAVITGFSPDTVSMNQTLTITGTNFLNNVDSLTINGVKQNITSLTANTIVLSVLPKTFTGKIIIYKGGSPSPFDKNVAYKETYSSTQFSTYGKADRISIDNSGNIYLITYNAVIKLSSAGALIDTLVKQDTTTFEDICARANGDILVSGQTRGTIFKIAGKNQLTVLYSFKKSADIFLTESSNKELFFSTSTDGEVYRLKDNGTISAFTSNLFEIAGIASDAHNFVYVTNKYSFSLSKFDASIINDTNPTELAHYSTIDYGGIGVHSKGGMIYICQNHRITKIVNYSTWALITGLSDTFYNDMAFTPSGDMVVCSGSKAYLLRITIN
jgi:hypothetical protein